MSEKIITEDDYREALKRFYEIYDVRENLIIANEMFNLIIRLEEYEKNNCMSN